MRHNQWNKVRRFKDILVILAKYGFDELLQRLDMPGAQWLRDITPIHREMGLYERIRCALEEIGPTFIKFGQIMSLRPDLLPRALLSELEKLQDTVPPDDFARIEQVLEENLEMPLREVFSVFDATPAAAASLSQVHRAVLRREGRIVSVKVQRPGVREKIISDLDMLEDFAGFLHNKVENLTPYDLPHLVQVVRRMLMKEIDFAVEARHLKTAAAYAAGTRVHIPAVFDRYSTRRVLVMEHVVGTRYKDILQASAIDARAVARQGLQAAIKQILEDGFFHADPHPGNLLVTQDMCLCIIDWGMVGRLTRTERFELIGLLKALVERDSEALTDSLLTLCLPPGDRIRPRDLERDLLEILDAFYAVPIKDVNIGELLLNITVLIRRHSLRLKPEMVIMIKALVTAEGSARLAYPNMDVASELKDSVGRLAVLRHRPEELLRRLRHLAAGLWSVQHDLPRRIQRLADKLERGDLNFRFQVNKIEALIHALENASNRLTVGIITGAVIMASSMIITTGIGPFIFGYPALGVIGYLLSVVLGIWIIITIIRNNRY